MLKMPSAYTARLCDLEEQTFAEFVLHCATSHFHDVSQLPDRFEVDICYEQSIASAQKRLERAEAMTEKAAAEASIAEFELHQREYQETEQIFIQRMQVIETMLQKVLAWMPSSPYLGLRRFMIDQLQQSLVHDCDGDLFGSRRHFPSLPPPRDGATYRADAIAAARSNLEHHRERLAEAVCSVKRDNDWLSGLRTSLMRTDEK